MGQADHNYDKLYEYCVVREPPAYRPAVPILCAIFFIARKQSTAAAVQNTAVTVTRLMFVRA